MGRLIRRVLFTGRFRDTGWTAISLGTTLPQPSSGLPGNGTGSPIVPCLTLLRTRFTEPTASPRSLVGSYPTVSPLPGACAPGGLLSVALSRGLPRVGVTHRPALWSPDVPRRTIETVRRDRLADPLAVQVYRRRRAPDRRGIRGPFADRRSRARLRGPTRRCAPGCDRTRGTARLRRALHDVRTRGRNR